MKRSIANIPIFDWSRRLSVLLVVALLLPLMGMAPNPEVAPRAHPILLQMAAERPSEMVGIIVQKTVKDTQVESLVARLGGTVTQDLHIINAFGAQVPAKAIVELARADGVRWVSLDAPVWQTGAEDLVFTTWATELGTAVPNTFADASAMVSSGIGPDNVFGAASRGKAAFSGFDVEVAPGYAISKIEVVLRAYVPAKLAPWENVLLILYAGQQPIGGKVLYHSAFDHYVGADKAGTIYVDIPNALAWKWADLDNLKVIVNQSSFGSNHSIYYDAIGLRVTSVLSKGSNVTWTPTLPQPDKGAVNASKLATAFPLAVRAPEVWNEPPAYLQGRGVTVAVVDSGIAKNQDLGKRLIRNISFNKADHDSTDKYGHGTFVAGVIAGDGSHSKGQYIGIAPQANLLNVRVSDDEGMAYESDVVAGLQWINDNRALYNIRVVNLSSNSAVVQSYHTSPLDAAVEILWFDGVVVVVSAGNNDTSTLYPPANDPFVITVGATDDQGTPDLADDVIASFSTSGKLENGLVKPDLVAPGRNIIGFLPNNKLLTVGQEHPSNNVDGNYFRMSGTSLAAPMVSGAAALLLQDEPGLKPDQVKYRLTATASKNWPGYDPVKAGAGYLDIYAAVHGNTTQTANTGLTASKLLWTGNSPITWGSVNWNSVNWNSVNWNSVNWNSVNWNSVNWNSDVWEP
jgi:serine protease AprX